MQNNKPKWRYRLDLWFLNHDWPTRHPRTYLFFNWVVMYPRAMGFMAWWRWVWRKDSVSEVQALDDGGRAP